MRVSRGMRASAVFHLRKLVRLQMVLAIRNRRVGLDPLVRRGWDEIQLEIGI